MTVQGISMASGEHATVLSHQEMVILLEVCTKKQQIVASSNRAMRTRLQGIKARLQSNDDAEPTTPSK
jgi:hypothetical protein